MNNNVQHLKVLLIGAIMLFSINVIGQDVNENNEKYCLFGYISEDPEEFQEVISYVEYLGIRIISICDDERLIYVCLNEKYKDRSDLFTKIEKHYNGKCYFKSSKNEILLYSSCSEKTLKDQLTRKEQ